MRFRREARSQAERSASGRCVQCGDEFTGRQGKRFWSDACRTKFGREKKARDVTQIIGRLQRLAGMP